MNRRDLLTAAGVLAGTSGVLWWLRVPQTPKMTAAERQAYVQRVIRRGRKAHPMKVWIDSPACKGRRQCGGCRLDSKFRAKLAQFFEMPPGWPACPHGITVDCLPEVPGEPVFPARRREVCQKCGWACGLNKRSGCYVRRFLRTAKSTCPEGHWTSERIET